MDAITDRELIGLLLSNVPQMVDNRDVCKIGTDPPIRADQGTIRIQGIVSDL